MIAEPLTIIGYSGHAFVVIETAISAGRTIRGYFEREPKPLNPYELLFLGSNEKLENNACFFEENAWFVGIGDNSIRRKVQESVGQFFHSSAATLVHPSAYLAQKSQLGTGVLVAAQVVIHPLANIGNGVICNTGAVIEHECEINDFVHIAPGAVLAGNVSVGNSTFVGANSVVKQGVRIGKNCIIGAGSVIIRDIPDGTKVVGNPGRVIS